MSQLTYAFLLHVDDERTTLLLADAEKLNRPRAVELLRCLRSHGGRMRRRDQCLDVIREKGLQYMSVAVLEG